MWVHNPEQVGHELPLIFLFTQQHCCCIKIEERGTSLLRTDECWGNVCGQQVSAIFKALGLTHTHTHLLFEGLYEETFLMQQESEDNKKQHKFKRTNNPFNSMCQSVGGIQSVSHRLQQEPDTKSEYGTRCWTEDF